MQNYSFFIGIDISKKWIDVCLTVDGDKSLMPHRRFGNTGAGFAKMLKWARSRAKALGINGRWLFCMEHTGVYTLPLCAFLHRKGLDYIVESGLEVKYSVGVRRGKSDPADAADLAVYVFQNHRKLRPAAPLAPKLMELKNLLGLHRRLKKAQVAIRVAARELAAFSEKAVHGRATGMSGETAGHLKGQVRAVKAAIAAVIDSDPELARLYGLVSSVVGVRLIIGGHLLVHTNAFRAFTDPRKFACHIGLVPFSQISGTSKHVPDKVSQLADKRLKALVSNGAMSAIRHDGQIRTYYERKLAEGKNKYLVQNNVKNKLVQRIFAVVKRGTPYVKLANH